MTSSAADPHTLWYTRCSVPTAFALALRHGALHAELVAEGIALRSLAESDDRALRQAHFDHSAPDFFRQGGNLPPLIAFSRGADLRVIGLTCVDTLQAAFVLPQSGIATAADLAGRRLGFPRRVGDPLDFWQASVLRGYARVLAPAGLTLADVELVELPIERDWIDGSSAAHDGQEAAPLWDAAGTWSHQREEILALADGRVDAIYSDGTMAPVPAAFLGARAIAAPLPGPGEPLPANGCMPLALTCSATLLERRPDLVERVLAHVLDAAERAAADDAARGLVAAETGLPEQLLTLGYSPAVHRQLAVELSPRALAALGGQIDFLAAHDFLAAPFALDDVVAPEPLARVIARRAAVGHAAAAR